MSDSLERRTILTGACEQGQQILQNIMGVVESRAKDVTLALAVSSPLQPFWVSESDSLLFYQLKKSACFLGVASGTGFIISRLPSPHPTLINWSPPCFVTISLTSLGFSLGRRTISSFTACMTKDTRLQLATEGKIGSAGFEIALSMGAGLQDRAELIGGSCTGGMIGTVGVNKTAGGLVDLSFAGGSLKVDEKKNAAAYGSEFSVANILGGKVDPPGEMQQLYAAVNSIVHHVERVSAPSRVSASLERLTAGFDPERRMVLEGGAVIKEAGSDPSGYAQRTKQQAQQEPEEVASGGTTFKAPASQQQQQQAVVQPPQDAAAKLEAENAALRAAVEAERRLRAAEEENAALKAQLEALKSGSQKLAG